MGFADVNILNVSPNGCRQISERHSWNVTCWLKIFKCIILFNWNIYDRTWCEEETLLEPLQVLQTRTGTKLEKLRNEKLQNK